MSDKTELLGRKEYNTVGEMLLTLVSACPYVPEDLKTPVNKIKYQSIDTDDSIGIFTLPGAKYLKKNVMGGFTAQIKFQVAYKSLPSGNGEIVERQSVLDSIMEWLENIDKLPTISGGRTITKIETTNSAAYADEKGSDKSTTFVADAVMEYEAE